MDNQEDFRLFRNVQTLSRSTGPKASSQRRKLKPRGNKLGNVPHPLPCDAHPQPHENPGIRENYGQAYTIGEELNNQRPNGSN